MNSVRSQDLRPGAKARSRSVSSAVRAAARSLDSRAAWPGSTAASRSATAVGDLDHVRRVQPDVRIEPVTVPH